jgi:hypothetical protein
MSKIWSKSTMMVMYSAVHVQWSSCTVQFMYSQFMYSAVNVQCSSCTVQFMYSAVHVHCSSCTVQFMYIAVHVQFSSCTVHVQWISLIKKLHRYCIHGTEIHKIKTRLKKTALKKYLFAGIWDWTQTICHVQYSFYQHPPTDGNTSLSQI